MRAEEILYDAAKELAIHIREELANGYGNQFATTPEAIEQALAVVRSNAHLRAIRPDFLPDDGIPVEDAE